MPTTMPTLFALVLLLDCGCTQAAAGAFAPAPRSPTPTGPMTGRPVLADMDGDGDLDVVVACGTCCGSAAHADSGRVLVLRNDGRGGLLPVGRGIVVGPSVRKVAVGDLDGDGRPDVVAAEHDSYAVTALRNLGDGRLEPFAGSPFAAMAGPRAHTHEIALADLDGDGRLDVLTTNANDHAISVLLGNGQGAFTAAAGSPFRTPARHPYDGIAIGDFNGDRHLDVVVPLLRDGRIALMVGDGRGGLLGSRDATWAVSARPGYVTGADVDRDGDLDVLASHDDVGSIDVLLNDGHGAFTQAPGAPFDLGGSRWGLAAGDLDGDGCVDLAVGSQSGAEIVLARGDGRGGFSIWATLAAGESANYVAIGDLDGNRSLDVVVASYAQGEITAVLSCRSGK